MSSVALAGFRAGFATARPPRYDPLVAGTRARLAGYIASAIGVAALTPHARPGFAAFALSPGGLAVVAIALSLGGDGIEEMGTLRRIRAGLVLRLVAAVLVVQAVGWRFADGLGEGAVAFGEALIAAGLVGVAFFAYRDARVLGDLRHGQRISLRRIGERDLEIAIGGAAITVPLVAVGRVAPARATNGRGLLLAVDTDARTEGPVAELPWVEERLRSRTLFLDEHQLGGDARDVARRIADAKAREPGGYR